MANSRVLESVYTTPREPGSFSGADKLRRSVGKRAYVTVKEVDNWLKGNDTYTKHRSSRKTFKRNQIVVGEIDGQWQGDLAEMGNIARDNDGVRYLMILIDVVSKHTWVEPLKTKEGKSVLEGLKQIFERTERRPGKLQTDDGKEFLNVVVQRYLRDNDITFFTVKSDKKAAIAERMVRTLKDKIYRYMHEKHTKRYVDVLQDLVSSYNETFHKSIKMAPVEVNTGNEGAVLRSLYGKDWIVEDGGVRGSRGMRKEAKFKPGDMVRISSVKGVFKKGYWGNWSEELFRVDSMKESAAPYQVYRLKDWNNEVLEGVFYEYEMQKVSKELDGYWKVEKIIEKRKVQRGRWEYFVKWQGYPASMNSWVDERDIKKIGG
jgi:hypothetical protein